MKRIISLFEPAPHIKEIEDPDLVKEQYQYWRIRVFYSMFIGYAFYYFTRKSFTFAMPAMIHELGFDKSQLGILASIMSISYGLSKFTSGVFADRSNPRYFMAIGLILTGILNICFGMSSSLTLFAVFWGLNGWFQGWGWPPCARYLTHWYSQSERGRWWAMWNTSHNIGGALILLIASYCAQRWGWRYAMYIPGLTCIFVGFYLINRLRDTPQSLGLPPIERYRNDYSGSNLKQDEEEKELSTREILIEHVLSNKFIWLLAVANFFVYVIRTGVNDWSALFLVETKGYSLMGAGACVGWFEVGGFFGSLVAGWASDRIFGGRRGPINVLFSFGVVSSIAFFWMVPQGYVVLDSCAMLLTGFWIFGPQMLIGMAAAELAHKKAAATGSGFTGWLGYIGAAAAGYPLGKITQDYGWNSFFWTLGICGLVAMVLLLPLWRIKGHQSEPIKKKAENELAKA